MTALTFDDADDRPVDFVFMVLAAVFLASLVVCNLIANKFLTVDLGFKVFVLSAGALPYPITFLATDLLSELYGRRRANRVVWSGFAASLFALLALWLGAQFPALSDSPVSDATYSAAFSNTWRVIAASMTAYLFAQFVDVRLFHFWKRLTAGRHLWLRRCCRSSSTRCWWCSCCSTASGAATRSSRRSSTCGSSRPSSRSRTRRCSTSSRGC